MNRNRVWHIIAVCLFSCAVMAFVETVLQPGYVIKSGIKIAVFLLPPLLLSLKCRDIRFRELFRPRKKGFAAALALGVCVYALVLGGYFLVAPFFDFSAIAGNLTQNAGVNADNFLFVALYISFVNSMLEEFFFRGFLFMNLKAISRRLAYLFSSIAFALYHIAIMLGWFSPGLFALILVGLTVGGLLFNYLNERLGTIYGSWLVHMFANFAINTIGFILLT